MSRYPHRLLVITAALSRVKSPYPHGGTNPNRITQSLIAVLPDSRFHSYVRKLTNSAKNW